MTHQHTSSAAWALIAGACLVLGLAVGYVVFGGPHVPPPVVTTATTAGPSASETPPSGLFDEQAAQALRSILAQDPKDLTAATRLGNMLFDAGRYAEAVPIYQQAFALDPVNVNLSTDLGTALWYSGRPDDAIAQFEKSLAINPTHPQTLFNLGVVKRDGKQDLAGAVQAWETLLASNPAYPERAKVQQVLDQARQQVTASPIAPVRSTR
jgi:cytochrome c-type biogenesis protein CcmH/NrfG